MRRRQPERWCSRPGGSYRFDPAAQHDGGFVQRVLRAPLFRKRTFPAMDIQHLDGFAMRRAAAVRFTLSWSNAALRFGRAFSRADSTACSNARKCWRNLSTLAKARSTRVG